MHAYEEYNLYTTYYVYSFTFQCLKYINTFIQLDIQPEKIEKSNKREIRCQPLKICVRRSYHYFPKLSHNILRVDVRKLNVTT